MYVRVQCARVRLSGLMLARCLLFSEEKQGSSESRGEGKGRGSLEEWREGRLW